MPDARIERERIASIQDALAQNDDREPHCSAACVLQTFTLGTYPTTAGATYACHPVAISGGESEGATPTFEADTTVIFYAINLGSAVPPSGTKILGHQAGGRWAIRWDG